MEAKVPISSPVLPLQAVRDSQSSSSSTTSSIAPSRHSSRRNSPGLDSATLQCPESSSIADSLKDLKISERESKEMFSILGAIFHQVEEEEGVVLVDELRTVFEKADASYRVGYRDVEALGLAKGALDEMWESHSKYLTDAAKVLADASRDPAWRIPLGEAGVLDFFLGIVAVERERGTLLEQALRLIGNTCADTDENRQRVVEQRSLRPIICLISEDNSLASICIPVLYNICVDYEPAEKQAAGAGCVPALIEFLQKGVCRSSALLNYTCQLLESVVRLSPGLESSPDNAAVVLFDTASGPLTDLDDCSLLVNLAVSHLREERFQKSFLRSQALELPLTILSRTYSSESPIGSRIPPSDTTHPIYTADEQELVSTIRSHLVHTLSDLSALPDFAAIYPLESPSTSFLKAWLSTTHSQLQVCACIILGNLSRSDGACETMVHQLRVHETLVTLLQESDDTQVLHSVAGFLKNLALLPANKTFLGEAGVISALPRLWTMDVIPQLQHAGASLTRQLVSNSYANVQLLLISLSPDPDSPAHERTYLSLLLSLNEKSDDFSTKIEIARTVTAICRTLNTPQPGVSTKQLDETAHRLYALHVDIARPLAAMVSQSRWPVVRSEGWFAFALMARSREGSIAVSDVVHAVEVYQPLAETITGKALVDGGDVRTRGTTTREVGVLEEEDMPAASEGETDQEKQIRARDRDNALILVSKLLENMGEGLGTIRRGILEDLLHGHNVPTSYNELAART